MLCVSRCSNEDVLRASNTQLLCSYSEKLCDYQRSRITRFFRFFATHKQKGEIKNKRVRFVERNRSGSNIEKLENAE